MRTASWFCGGLVSKNDFDPEYYGEEYREMEPDYYDWDIDSSENKFGGYF